MEDNVTLTTNEITSTELAGTDTVKTQEETSLPSKNDLLREMSKEYGVNLFDAEGLAKFKEYQDSLKTEADKIQEQLETYKAMESGFTAKEEEYQTQIAALELGIPTESLKEAIALAKVNMTEGQSIRDGLQVVKEKYAGLFTSTEGTKVTIGTQINDIRQGELSKSLSEQEAYMSKWKNSPYYKK